MVNSAMRISPVAKPALALADLPPPGSVDSVVR
jgi:hypothetical protein